MPGKVGVKIKAGRNLPVMDRGSDTTDAYVEIKLGNVTHKTDVCRKTLNPQWNTDWFRFEVDDAELQDEPLQIRLMDHDTYSANDAIGKVNISLNPLCLENAGQSNQGKGAVMSGWIPVFDTMHGIRGEVNIIVKVDLFSDANKFRQSSCGVQFFHSPCIPHGYRAQVIHGFVEELVVNDDPEYQWIDKIRTPRASNEARQVVFLTLSGQVQRKIGLKAINLGANAVIGYTQCFDLEGDVGVVVRGIGTAVTLVKIQETVNQPTIDNALIEERTLNYFKFLSGNSNDFDDLAKSKFDTDYMDLDPNNVVYKILGIEPIDKCSARSPNIIVKRKWKPNIKDGVIYEESFNENDGMRQLLEQEDQRGEKPNRKFHHHVKRITTSSKTLLNEKFNAFKARLNDDKLSENDSKSLNSSWSDISFTETARSSLTDLRNLMRFKKARKNYNRSVSDGSAMATLLVSSVMYGRDTSLESISEVHDSQRSSPSLTRLRTNSKSESMSNLLSSSCEEKTPITKLGSESMKNLSPPNKLKKDKQFLRPKTLGNQNIAKSNISMSTISGSSSTSSDDDEDEEDDEECSDEEEECSEITTNDVIVVDPDTVSMVVKTVLAKGLHEYSDDWIQPGSTLVNDDNNLINSGKYLIKYEKNLDKNLMIKSLSFTKQASIDGEVKNDEIGTNIVTLSGNQKIIQTGGTRILKTDKDSHITESRIMETNASAAKLEKMLKQPSIDEDVDNWIEPGSTNTDEPETIDKGRRQSLLHDLKENISGKFHHLQEHMHMPHFTDHSKILHKHGLLDTAMETMLIEKANILGAEPVLITNDNDNSQLIHYKLPENSELLDDKKHDSLDFIAKTLHLPFGHGHTSQQQKHKNEIRNDSGLLGNAMRAMLLEPLNIAEEICHDEPIVPPFRIKSPEIIELPIEDIKFVDNKSIQNEKPSMLDIGNGRKDFKELDLPINSISCNLQQQTINIEELGNFYSSEPELNQTNDLLLSPLNDDSRQQPAPFISLTNLNANENCDNNNNNNNNNCCNLISNQNQLTPICNSYVLPEAIIIHPSTPLTSPETPSKSFTFDDTNPIQIHIINNNNNNNNNNNITTVPKNSNISVVKSSIESIQNENNNQKIDLIIKKTIYLIDNKNINNNINKNAKKNNKKNLINKKSSSYTNLSCTNKAPMLAPSPYYLKNQLRSSTELVASGSTSPAIQAGALGQQSQPTTTATVAASTQSSNLTTANIIEHQQQQQHLTPILQQGHNRAESVGGGAAANKNLSPAKVSNIGSAATATTTSGTSSGNNTIPTNNKNQEIYRRSSDSDLSVTPKGNSICVASDRLVAATTMMRLSAPTSLKNTNPDNLDMLEYPFLTMCKYPTGFILHLGATVAARSVKLLERVPNPDEPETRDSWWTELRMEIRSHARALGCNVILGYSEVTTISDDVCVLSATGTAAVINMSYSGEPSQNDFTTTTAGGATSSSKKDLMVSSLDERECLRDSVRNNLLLKENGSDLNYVTKEFSSSFGGTTKTFPNNFLQNKGCAMCHIPYSTAAVPFNIRMKKCSVCKRGKVPDVLLATIEIPECLHITGRGCFMQAQVVRAKKDLRSESNAKEISDGLPFLEYELHRVLINKLKAKGMNAIFGLKAHVAIGEKMMALIATGTAVFLTALPPPSVPKIVAGNSWHDTARLNDLQKSLQETVERNREIYQLKSMDPDFQNGSKQQSDTDDSDEELLDLDLNAGSKDTCVLEVDDIEDLEIISLLMEPCPPEGFHVVNTQSVPGLQDMEVVRNLQMFTQIWRAKLSVGSNNERFPKHFQRLLQTIYFKLRTMIPCAICDLKFRLDLPESDEIQILVTGMALGLGEPSKLTKIRRKTISNNQSNELSSNQTNNSSNTKKSQDDELIFSLDDDQNTETAQFVQTATGLTNLNYGTHSLKLKKNSPARTKYTPSVKYSRHLPVHDRYGVDITPLSYVPGGKIEKYLGNLNFFFIRESTSIRENGGISGFVHSFITEILAVVRAHISALGGNAMVSFYMTELLLVDNQHKNQGQCLVNIGGDVVFVSYYADD